MGKAARLKQERRREPAAKTPPPVGKKRPPLEGARAMRTVLLGTGAVVLVIAIAVGVLLSRKSSSPSTPAAAVGSLSKADRNASASLVSAADKVGFHPTTEPGTGQIEDLPASAAQAPTNSNLLPIGSKAPAFTLKTPQGQSVSLSDYRGSAVLLEFFATWCPHCNAEASHLDQLYSSLSKNKVAFVAVNADGETAPSVFAFHRYYGTQYPALLDPSSQPGSFDQPGGPGKISTAYRVLAFPTFYVIDPQGRIAWRSDGEQPDSLLRQELLQVAPRG